MAKVALSFGGSGLMMIWQMGVASVLAESSELMDSVEKVHGTSGGAITGAMLLGCPDRLREAVQYYCSGVWLRNATSRDLVSQERLLRQAIDDLDIAVSVDLKFAPHVTAFEGLVPHNRVLDFKTRDELVDAIAASCCLSPSGVLFRGERFYDGGFSDPLPSDPALPTICVSILDGKNVAIAPAKHRTSNRLYTGPPFRRYFPSTANAHALLETVLLTPTRARARFDQGRHAADAFLNDWLRHPPR